VATIHDPLSLILVMHGLKNNKYPYVDQGNIEQEKKIKYSVLD